MQRLYEALDSGAYDRSLLVFLVSVFVLLTLWERFIRRRAAADFYRAQHYAQKIFECPMLGRTSSEFRQAVFEALTCWEKWQRRPIPSFEAANGRPTRNEWHALSLLQSLPPMAPAVAEAVQYEM